MSGGEKDINTAARLPLCSRKLNSSGTSAKPAEKMPAEETGFQPDPAKYTFEKALCSQTKIAAAQKEV